MADSNSVIDTLSLEIDITVKGGNLLAPLTKMIEALGHALEYCNEQMKTFNNLSKKMGMSFTPSSGQSNTSSQSTSAPATSTALVPVSGTTPVDSTTVPDVGTENLDQVAESLDEVSEKGNDATSSVSSFGKALMVAARSSLKSFGEKLSGIVSSFARIVKYRAIRSIIKSITEGFSTGIQDLAMYSDEFNNTMSKLSTYSLYFKNSIATLVAPLLELLIPILVKVIEKVVDFINKINQMVAVLNGSNTYYKASADHWVDYRDSIDKTTKSAKELKNQLMGFDEINKLQDTSSSSSSTTDYSDMFTTETMDNSQIAEAEERLEKVKVLAGAIGILLAGWKITRVVSHIMSIYNTLKGVVTTSSAIKGLWSTGLGITAIIAGVALVVKGIWDWVEAGEMTNQVFAEILIGIGLITAGAVALGGGWIAAAIGAVAALAVVVYKYWDEISEFFGTIGTWVYDNVILPVWNVIDMLFGWIWDGFLKPIIDNVVEICTGIWDAVKAVADKIAEIMSTIKQIIVAVVTYIWDNYLKKYWDKAVAIAKKVKEFFSGIASWIYEKAIKPLTTYLSSIGQKVIDFISNGIKVALNGVFSLIEKLINGFINGLNKAVNWINDKIGTNISVVQPLSIPRFATGGFPEDGVFMANHTELVGEFSNGKTAVANNQQITDGIYRAVKQAMDESRSSGNSSTTFVAQLNGKTLFEEVVKQNKSATKSYGSSPLTSY